MTHRQLYGLAALLWLIAGVNVLRIGLVNWPSETNILVSILWLIGLADLVTGHVLLSGRDRLRGGRGCDDLAPTTRRDYWCDRSGRGLGLFKVGIVGSRGGDGICGVCRARLLSSGSLSRGGGGSGDLATTAWGRGTHGITDCLILLVRFC